MAEKEVLFEDNMETQAQDFNNLQDYLGKSIDDVVVDAIDAGNAYTGLTVSKAAATQVQIAIGRLYWGGVVYILEDPVIIDFQSISGAMPVTQQRQIAIVAWGSTIQTDTQPRNFVVDADTGQAQPESVSMTQIRLCNIGSVNGVEAPSPNYPPVSPTNLLIAYVLMNPAGVVSIQQSTSTQLDNLTDLGNQLNALATIVNQEESQIVTLQTGLAAIAAELANFVTLDAFKKLSDLVNWCYQKLLQPAAYVLNTIDNFFDVSQSAVGTNVDGAYAAYIASGLRFPGISGASWTGKLTLSNPTEPYVQAWDTFILPAPSGMRIRMDCSFPSLDWAIEAVLNHPYWTFTPRKLNWARHRYRCGPPYLPTGVSAVLVNMAINDPLVLHLMFDTESWSAVANVTISLHPDFDPDFPRWFGDRWKYFWRDYVDVDYWAKIYTNFSYSHNHMAQSFLNAQDGWLGGITLFSMLPNFFQPLSLHITQCDPEGVPDNTATLGLIDLDANSIQPCYNQPIQVGDIIQGQVVTHVEAVYSPSGSGAIVGHTTETETIYQAIPVYAYPVRINFSPIYLKAGQRYAFHVHSTYGHQFAVSIDRSCYQVHGGDFWDFDGVRTFRVAASPKSLRFLLHYLTWGNWPGAGTGGTTPPTPAGFIPATGGQLRYDIEMTPLTLAGGITNVDILAEHIVPPATGLNYAIMINNSWMPFAEDPNTPGPLNSSVNFCRLKAVFTGTSDLMPGLSLVNSQVKLWGPTINSYHHISTAIPISSTTVGVKVQAMATGFTAHHGLNCFIHTTGGQLTPSPVTQGANPDGTTQFTWTFATTGITSYQVELNGSTDGTGDNFVVSQRASFSA